MRWSALCLLVAGCAKPPPPTCEDSTETACFKGVFSGLLGARMEGVEVCAPELEEIPCVTSDADGGWKMPGLPLDSDVIVTATTEDTFPTLFAQTTSLAWYDWYKVLLTTGLVQTQADRIDSSLDPGKGHIIFLVWEGLNIAGVNTPKISDVVVTVTSGEGEVFYGNSLGLASPDATETTGDGSGGVLNLSPGVHELQFDAPGGPCSHSFSWDFADGEPVPVPIEAGFATGIDVVCPPG